MSAVDLPKEQDLVEYRVDRILEEVNTDTRIVVLVRQDDALDTFPIWVGAAEGNAIKLALDTMITPRPMSHDLIKSFAEHLNITIQRVVIADVKGSTITPWCMSPTKAWSGRSMPDPVMQSRWPSGLIARFTLPKMC